MQMNGDMLQIFKIFHLEVYSSFGAGILSFYLFRLLR